MPITEYQADQVLNSMLGGASFTPPATLYPGLIGAPTWVAGMTMTAGGSTPTYVVSSNFNSTVHHIFVCTTSGIAGGPSEPSWNQSAGGVTTDGTGAWTEVTDLFATSNITGAELPSTGNYARGGTVFSTPDATPGIANNSTNWPNASGGPPTVKANGVTVYFNIPTVTWLQEVGVFFFDAATGGNLRIWQLFTTPITSGAGSGPPTFGVDAFQITAQ